MKHTAWRSVVCVCAALLWSGAAFAQTPSQPAASVLPGSDSTADHSKFEILKKEFSSGPDVTAACLSCHTEASHQVMQTVHWQWEFTQPVTGQTLGKAQVLNSFCGNVASNEARCTSCHAGYGWTDIREGPMDDPERVDCLACHDTSGQYAKLDNKAGHPAVAPLAAGAKTITGATAWAVDLSKAAQSVGDPGRENCGNCHFYGGGGDNVKHGDLSSALFRPDISVDVHMSAEGANFTCVSCHVSEKHMPTGSRYDTNIVDPHADTRKPGEARTVASCASCHSDEPHRLTVIGLKLNDHTDRLACETCHIPAFARGGVATKTVWDWSTAGMLVDGKPISMEEYTQGDGTKLHTYVSTKGDFEWGENVVPYYAWFDGTVEYTLAEQTIDPTQVVEINRLYGAAQDPASRIAPFKQMLGRQAYDAELNKLAFNNVFGPGSDSAFWVNFDWEKSLQAGMDYVGSEYSGRYGFVDTHMYWPINHMVAPARDALDCTDCHAVDGRMATVAGIYLPGAGVGIGGKLGLLMFLATAFGVAGHGAIRFVRRGRKNGGAQHG
jgi:octaheme c-type cytochrome (tetrathionate reductase family)